MRSAADQDRDAASAGEIDFAALWRGIVARKAWIVGPTIVAVAAMLVYVTLAKPRYTAEAKVFLEAQESYFTRPDKVDRETAGALDPEAVLSQVQLVTSRDLARQAIKKLGLQGNPEFDPLADGLSPLTRVLVLLGLQRDPTALSPEDRILESYFEKLAVFQVPKTRVLTIEFSARDPDLAARAANTIAELYLGVQANAKKDNARQAGAWLSGNIDELRSRVADAEARVEEFRARSGLLVGNNNTTISAQQLSELNTQLANARSAQSESQAKARLIRDLLRQGRVMEVPDVAKDELIRRIAEQRVTLRAQIALESRTLLPQHPRMKELQAQVADIESELRQAGEKAARVLENDSRLAGGRVDNLTATLESQKRTVATGNGEEVQLRALEREAKVAREQLESYLGKFREASARDTANASPADARIISRAVAPQLPSFPKKIPMLALAALAGLILSSSVVVAGELLAGPPRAAQPADPIDEPVTPGAAAAFGTLSRPDREAVATPDDPSERGMLSKAEDFLPATTIGELAARVRAARRSGEAARVLVTGAQRGVGSTATAIALARELARDARAVLVDLDDDTPGLDGLVATDGEAPLGMSDLLAGTASFAQVIHRDRGSRLHVVPAGQDAGRPEGLALALDALVATYDMVVLDAPAASVSPTAFSLAHAVDAVVLATRADGARAAVDAARTQFLASGAPEVLIIDVAAAAPARSARDAA